jgi:hypothetical protein
MPSAQPQPQQHQQQHQRRTDDEDDDKRRRNSIPVATIVLVAWIVLVTAAVIYVAASATTRGATLPLNVQKKSDHVMHKYAFNIYDTAVTHYPPRETADGIPHLHWRRLQWFRVCCRYNVGKSERIACDIEMNPHLVQEENSSTYLVVRPTGSMMGARCTLYWQVERDA